MRNYVEGFVEMTPELQQAYAKACRKHPDFKPTLEGAVNVLGEEFGEVCRAVDQGEGDARIIEEAMDLAVSSLRLVRALRTGHFQREPGAEKPVYRAWIFIPPEELNFMNPAHLTECPSEKALEEWERGGWRLVELKGR